MTVKNIVRNLFVSGCMVLSGNVVCGMSVSASDKKIPAQCLKCGDCIKSVVEEVFNPTVDRVQDFFECVADYAKCLEKVILNSESDINECKIQRDNCVDKVEQDLDLMEQAIKSKL